MSVKTKIIKKQIEMHLVEKNGAPWSEAVHRVGLLIMVIGIGWGFSLVTYRELLKDNHIVVINQASASWDVREKEEVVDEAHNSTESGDGVLAQKVGGEMVQSVESDTVSLETLIREAFPECPGLMVAIAKAESGMKPEAVNRNRNGSVDRGLFQINSIHKYTNLEDPTENIKAARAIFDSQGITAWAAYNNGSYKQFLQ